MKKKVLAALLATMMVASLTACGSKGETTTDAAADTTTEGTTDAAAEDTAAEDTAAAGETKDLADLKLAFIVGTENDAFYQSVEEGIKAECEKLGIPDLYFKVEQGPTLSLKDRGTALCVLKALEFGCKTVCLSSSGNNAASVSAYGSRAGLNPVVFVQKHVSAAKIFKSLVYGGRVVRIDGDMAAASRICGEMVKRRKWFQCGGPNPYRIAAKRTFAYGIVQQLGRAPDTVLIPCGGGAGMVAAHDAFREMFAAGVIDRMPRLVGVQLQACDPTARAFHEGRDAVTPVDKKPSLSDAIMNNNPYWGRYCLQAVRETGGTMISVSDADFIRTIRVLGREEGLFTEPAGSVSVAALRYLVKVPGFENPGLTVCNLTGHGLNVPQVATDESETPGVIPPTVEAVEAFLQS